MDEHAADRVGRAEPVGITGYRRQRLLQNLHVGHRAEGHDAELHGRIGSGCRGHPTRATALDRLSEALRSSTLGNRASIGSVVEVRDATPADAQGIAGVHVRSWRAA